MIKLIKLIGPFVVANVPVAIAFLMYFNPHLDRNPIYFLANVLLALVGAVAWAITIRMWTNSGIFNSIKEKLIRDITQKVERMTPEEQDQVDKIIEKMEAHHHD